MENNENLMQMPMEELRAQIGNVNLEARTFDLVWLSGERIKRFDWMRGEEYFLEFSREPGAARLARLKSGTTPLLNSHKQFSLENVVGVVEDGDYRGGRGTARVRLSARDDVKPILQDVQDKIIRNISAGIQIHRLEMLPPDALSGGLSIRRALDFEVQELSLIPIGADSGAAVMLAEERRRTSPCQVVNRRDPPMENNQDPNNSTAADLRDETLVDALERLGPNVRRHYHQVAEKYPALREQLAGCYIGARNLRDAGARVLEALAYEQERTQGNIRGVSFNDPYLNGGGGVQFVTLMAEALACRATGSKPSDAARDFMGLTIVDMARQILEMGGKRTTGMTANQIVQLGLHSTDDFPELLKGTGHRFLMAGYDSYMGGVRRICKKSTVPDFRPKQLLRLSEAPELLRVGQGGEYKYGTRAESKVSYSLETFGRIFTLTRQAMVNDDLSAFEQTIRDFGRAAAEFESQQLVALLVSNPTMPDGVALFHANHGNLAASGGAIGIDTLGAALAALRLQKGLDGKTPINVTPKYLVVAAAKEVIARQHVAQINATKASDVNPFTSDLEVVVDPRLDASSATAWYLAADPAVMAAIEYSYLEGEEGPQFEVERGFTIDGLATKVRLDFGAGVIEHRGIYKNPGA